MVLLLSLGHSGQNGPRTAQIVSGARSLSSVPLRGGGDQPHTPDAFWSCTSLSSPFTWVALGCDASASRSRPPAVACRSRKHIFSVRAREIRRDSDGRTSSRPWTSAAKQVGQLARHQGKNTRGGGGTTILASHCLKAWSPTHGLVTKSSAEVKFYAAVRASCEAVRVQMTTWGTDRWLGLHQRSRSNKHHSYQKAQHRHALVLWQGTKHSKTLAIARTIGHIKPSGLMTKKFNRMLIVSCIHKSNIDCQNGRVLNAPDIHSTE